MQAAIEMEEVSRVVLPAGQAVAAIWPSKSQ
jgi:hypothetical protein